METAGTYADRRVALAYEYAELSEELGKKKVEYLIKWNEGRGNFKTIAEVDRFMDATEVGQRIIFLKYKLEGLKEILQAYASKIRTLDTEAHNLA